MELSVAGARADLLPNSAKGSLALTEIEARQLQQCEETISAGLQTFVEVGTALLEIRDRRLYRGAYRTFEDYCDHRWGISRPRAYQLIDAAGVVTNLSTIVDTPLPSNERQARQLLRFDPELRPAIMRTTEAAAKTLEKPITAGMIQRIGEVITQAATTGVVDVGGEATPLDAAIIEIEAEAIKRQRQYIHDAMEDTSGAAQRQTLAALHSSESVEWYTPPQYIEAAREVMGGIDLDPASCEAAQENVRAFRYFTSGEDGLNLPWAGAVWLNPPYGRDANGRSNQAVWSARLIDAYESGDVTAAVLLVSANTSEKWFQPLWNYPICFTDHPIDFIPAGQQNSGANHGSVLVYFGDGVGRFATTFRAFGRVVIPRGDCSEVLP